MKRLIGAVALLILLFAAYTWVAMSWSYSKGERVGYIQKFSKKGWICKTWEGELAIINMPGTLTEKFMFTVRDDLVAKKLNELMSKRVVLVYEEHVGVPSSCFGETGYYVIDAKASD